MTIKVTFGIERSISWPVCHKFLVHQRAVSLKVSGSSMLTVTDCGEAAGLTCAH